MEDAGDHEMILERYLMKILGNFIVFCALIVMVSCSRADLYCVVYNSSKDVSAVESNDLLRQLRSENFRIHLFDTADEAFAAAPEHSGVLLLADGYPSEGVDVTQRQIEAAEQKSLKVFVEYPQHFGSIAASGRDTLELERIVVCDSISESLRPMDLLSFNRCVLNRFEAEAFDGSCTNLLVAAKVAGFDTAVYGLEDTPVKPLLMQLCDGGGNFIISTTRLSQYAHARYIPDSKVRSLFEYIIGWLVSEKVTFDDWPSLVRPAYGEKDILPSSARKESIAKGIEWYYNGHFIVDKSWKEDWADLYIGDGTMPVGPEVPGDFADGDGSLGVLEGHMSTIMDDGSQMYRYWMRADVQGESSYAFASAASLLERSDYADVASNLLEYAFREYRDDVRNDPSSPSYGLIGWAITHKGNYYGDDNARFILGALGASSFLDTHEFDKEIIESIVGNFRTSGKNGFRGCTLYEPELQSRGWRSFYNGTLVNPHPHFEAWLWACYLWLYRQTGWEPLLERTENGIRATMESYPSGWLWTNGIQQERARMILPLAWLYRVDPSAEHGQWLDYMVNEVLGNQVSCGGIMEELGDPGKSSFGRTPSNEKYGESEAPLIFDNGDPVADMLYTTNFAFVGLCEAAAATGKPEYTEALEKMNDFLIRIQVRSDEFKSVDGAWFRAFDYDIWDYWASNADAGWGAWSTLTGWIQSWIVGTQVLIEENTSLWELTAENDMSETAGQVISDMMQEYR